MTLKEFEDFLQKECEQSLRYIVETSKKYNFDEETMILYGSGYLTGYLSSLLRNEKIIVIENK